MLRLLRHHAINVMLQARKKDLQLTMLNQFKQSMAGPDWEIEDYEWYSRLSNNAVQVTLLTPLHLPAAQSRSCMHLIAPC